MLDVTLTLEVSGKQYNPVSLSWVDEVIQELEQFTTVNPGQLKQIAEAVRKGIESNIALGQQYTGGSVSPLKASTIQRKGFARPLFETGQLLGSVKLSQTGDNLYEVFISSNRSEIAGYLNFGTGKMKARPFFGISESVLKSIDDILNKPLTK